MLSILTQAGKVTNRQGGFFCFLWYNLISSLYELPFLRSRQRSMAAFVVLCYNKTILGYAFSSCNSLVFLAMVQWSQPEHIPFCDATAPSVVQTIFPHSRPLWRLLCYNRCNEFEPTQTANAQTGDSNLHCCLNQVQGLRMADMRDNEPNIRD
jgi:hypothetical protein